MKVAELSEMALPRGGSAKTTRLEKILTPENIKEHYTLIVQMLAAKLGYADITELEAHIKGTLMDDGEAAFQMKLVSKKLPAASNPREVNEYDWMGNLPTSWSTTNHSPLGAKHIQLSRYYHVGFNKGKWYAAFHVDSPGFVGKSKKFDTAEEMLPWFQKMYDKLEASPNEW